MNELRTKFIVVQIRIKVIWIAFVSYNDIEHSNKYVSLRCFSFPGDNLQFAFFLVGNRFYLISEGATHCLKNELFFKLVTF